MVKSKAASDDWEWTSPSQLITIRDGELSGRMGTTAEVKLAIKELKMLKRHLGAEKRQINAQIQAIRSSHNQTIMRRGPSMRGGGTLGKLVRAADQASRKRDRSEHAKTLDPYLAHRAQIDTRINMIEQAVAQLDVALIRAEAEELASKSPDGRLAQPDRAYCTSCGSSRPSRARFCSQCGARF